MCARLATWAVLSTLATAGLAKVVSPPRGWNSYDSFTANVNETEFLANCQAMADLLLPSGFDTCVVDYLWYKTSGGLWELDDYCRPIPDVARWPSSAGGKGFKVVADKVHAMGLKFGIQIMRGTSTYAQEKGCVVKGTSNITINSIVSSDPDAACPWKPDSLGVNVSAPGGQAFYDSLYEQYAVDWGVDFIKNDCVFRSKRVDEIKAQARSIEKFATTRPIVYSLSPGISHDFADEVLTGKAVASSVNMFRITDDDWDVWSDLSVHFDAAAAFARLIGGPGLLGGRSFPDLDMLPIGFVTEPGDSHAAPDHWSHLTPDEQRLQVTLWAIARSPLFFGGAVTKLRDHATDPNAALVLQLLTNPSVLAINTASSTNRQIQQQGYFRAWAATLHPPDQPASFSSSSTVGAMATAATSFACALFNTGRSAVSSGVRVTDVLGASAGVQGSCSKLTVTDVWSGKHLDDVDATGCLNATIPSHGARLFQLSCVLRGVDGGHTDSLSSL